MSARSSTTPEAANTLAPPSRAWCEPRARAAKDRSPPRSLGRTPVTHPGLTPQNSVALSVPNAARQRRRARYSAVDSPTTMRAHAVRCTRWLGGASLRLDVPSVDPRGAKTQPSCVAPFALPLLTASLHHPCTPRVGRHSALAESAVTFTRSSLSLPACRPDSSVRPPNARLQPPAARNARFEHDARVEGAPSVGCKPQLDRSSC